MSEREDWMTIGGARALAAERFLERKRIGLECAVEALETVGYHVKQDEQGKFRVTQPSTINESFGVVSFGSCSTQDEFLGEYPPILSTDQVAEILGVSKRTVTRLCVNSHLPSFKVGNMIRIPKHALIEYMAQQTG